MISWHEKEYLIAHLNSFEVGVVLKKNYSSQPLKLPFILFLEHYITYYIYRISFFIG